MKYNWIKKVEADGNRRVKLNGKYGLIDGTGKELTAICYDCISEPDKLGNRELKIINTRIVNFMNKSQDIERSSVRGIVK